MSGAFRLAQEGPLYRLLRLVQAASCAGFRSFNSAVTPCPSNMDEGGTPSTFSSSSRLLPRLHPVVGVLSLRAGDPSLGASCECACECEESIDCLQFKTGLKFKFLIIRVLKLTFPISEHTHTHTEART
jgi:hypothetical protein